MIKPATDVLWDGVYHERAIVIIGPKAGPFPWWIFDAAEPRVITIGIGESYRLPTIGGDVYWPTIALLTDPTQVAQLESDDQSGWKYRPFYQRTLVTSRVTNDERVKAEWCHLLSVDDRAGWGLSLEKGIAHFECDIVAEAVNLADILGAPRVYLLDCELNDKRRVPESVLDVVSTCSRYQVPDARELNPISHAELGHMVAQGAL